MWQPRGSNHGCSLTGRGTHGEERRPDVGLLDRAISDVERVRILRSAVAVVVMQAGPIEGPRRARRPRSRVPAGLRAAAAAAGRREVAAPQALAAALRQNQLTQG